MAGRFLPGSPTPRGQESGLGLQLAGACLEPSYLHHYKGEYVKLPFLEQVFPSRSDRQGRGRVQSSFLHLMFLSNLYKINILNDTFWGVAKFWSLSVMMSLLSLL